MNLHASSVFFLILFHSRLLGPSPWTPNRHVNVIMVAGKSDSSSMQKLGRRNVGYEQNGALDERKRNKMSKTRTPLVFQTLPLFVCRSKKWRLVQQEHTYATPSSTSVFPKNIHGHKQCFLRDSIFICQGCFLSCSSRWCWMFPPPSPSFVFLLLLLFLSSSRIRCFSCSLCEQGGRCLFLDQKRE